MFESRTQRTYIVSLSQYTTTTKPYIPKILGMAIDPQQTSRPHIVPYLRKIAKHD